VTSIYFDLTDRHFAVATVDFSGIGNLLAFCQAMNSSAFKCRHMNEHVRTTALWLDEAKPFWPLKNLTVPLLIKDPFRQDKTEACADVLRRAFSIDGKIV
jgi:hypothetical protein